MKKKNSTPRCEYCSFLIFSKKKIIHNRKIYHFTCYKRMSFDKKFYIDSYKQEIKGNDAKTANTKYDNNYKNEDVRRCEN
jgi:hypothetical protein